jgi:hypothetical protein
LVVFKDYSVTSQNTASLMMIFCVTFKFNVAGTKSDIVTEVNSVTTSHYLKETQYIKDVKFKIFFLEWSARRFKFPAPRNGLLISYIDTKNKYLQLSK